MGRRRKQKLPQELVETTIESLAQDGRGVTHIDGKAIFVDGALPGELIKFKYTRQSRKYDEANCEEVIVASADRVVPQCAHFGLCGGCSMQHLSPEAQVRHKQQAMLDSLKHIGKVVPDEIFEPIVGQPWGYRRKARLGAKFVRKKGRALVGFRERRNSFLADIESCPVLHESVGEHITDLANLIDKMDAKEALPQIEVAVGDHETALVFRHLEALSPNDITLLREYGETHQQAIFLQPKGPSSAYLLYPEQSNLSYAHERYETVVHFHPLDFFQVNTEINRQMVPRAIELLQIGKEDSVLDLFCGLGNFTLPMARLAKQVTGVEGERIMVERAQKAADQLGITNTHYYACNLMENKGNEAWIQQSYDRVLLDPPRLGAKEVIAHFSHIQPKRIVYVSCHPATLARDAGELVHTHGYKLLGAGVLDMFPHTGHIESIAVFEKA